METVVITISVNASSQFPANLPTLIVLAYLCGFMAKRRIRLSALGFLLLFSATLLESGLHSFVHHADSHFENVAVVHSCQHHPSDSNIPYLSFESSEDDCALCAHLLSYQHFAIQPYSEGFLPYADIDAVWFQAPFTGNTEIAQRPLRGPPTA